MRILWLSAMLVCLSCAQLAESQELTGERARWFVHDRFGMFIHWGVYSGAEGVWHGEKLRYDNDYAEWIQYRNRIGRDDYLTLLERFDWDAIDPEEWVLLAKRAGMRYVTLTAKHHDGFALWDSASNAYNVANHSPGGRDILAELAAACEKHGLKLGLYYSHWVDWEHPFGWDHSKEVYGIAPEDFDSYWQDKVMPQMRELLTDYGDIGLIWFDMWIHHSETVVTGAQLTQLKRLIRELQPDCLINSRLGLSVEEDEDVDFRTMNDNELGNEKLEFPWQTPGTVAHSWGFHSLEDEWRSTTTLLRSLIGNVSLNGNYMLNIGPRANGDVPHEIVDRLDAMGVWLDTNGDAIYGAGAFELRSDLHDWGTMTYAPDDAGGAKVYLHVYNWPLGGHLDVTGILTRPETVYALADTERAPLPIEHAGALTRIELPAAAPDPYVSVLVMELDRPPEVVRGLVARTSDGGFALTPRNASTSVGASRMAPPSRFGSVPAHVVVDDRHDYGWRVYVNEPGTFTANASYSYQGLEGEGTIVLELGGGEMSHRVEPTPMTVGEPRSDWVIESFESFTLGSVDIDAAGYYDIGAAITAPSPSPVKLNRIWLERKR